MLKRIFDVMFSIFALTVFAVPIMALMLLIPLTSPGPAIFWSERVGRGNTNFRMPKFRTMRSDAPVVATHLMSDPDTYLTPVGRFLRKTSLDELPQFWCVLTGTMSVVGPRPALFNQDDLIALRTKAGVDKLLPGLTGWAQINGRDELPIPEKVELDTEYMRRQSLWFDLKIVLMTISRVLFRQGVSH